MQGMLLSYIEDHEDMGTGTVNCGNGEKIFDVPPSAKLTKASVKLESSRGALVDQTEAVQGNLFSRVNILVTLLCESLLVHPKLVQEKQTGILSSHSIHSYRRAPTFTAPNKL